MVISISNFIFIVLFISSALGVALGVTALLGMPSEQEQKENAYYFLNLMKLTHNAMLALFIVIFVVLFIIVNQYGKGNG